MKKLIALFGVLMIISAVAFAGEENAPKATRTAISREGEIIKIFYRSENSDRVKVTIYDASSNIVFSENIKNKSSFVRPYNLENLPYGEYTIVLEDKNGKTKERINYDRRHEEVQAAIICKKNSRKALITLFSKAEAEVTYSVIDKDNNVLYSRSETVNGQALKSFNLERIEGLVTLRVCDNNGLLKNKTL